MSKKAAVSGFIANVLEFYEFSVFGFLSFIILPNFFSQQQDSLTTFFLLFAIAYIFRPLGGVIFGYIGDKYGNKVSLISSIILMSLSTFAMGCLPTAYSIGERAGYLLVLLRILQGISAGGELCGSILFSTENADKKHQAFISSCVGIGGMVGMLLASFSVTIMKPYLYIEDIWRIPFFFAASLGMIALYIRTKIESKIVYKTQAAFPLLDVIKNDTLPLVQIILVSSLGGCICYTLTIFLNSHAQFKDYINYIILSLAVCPSVFGYFADLYDRRKAFHLALTTSTLVLVLFFVMLDKMSGDSLYCLLAFTILSCSAYLGTMHSYMISAVINNRSSAYSFGYSIGMGVLGGCVPYILSKSYATTGSYAVFGGVYFVFALATRFITDRRRV